MNAGLKVKLISKKHVLHLSHPLSTMSSSSIHTIGADGDKYCVKGYGAHPSPIGSNKFCPHCGFALPKVPATPKKEKSIPSLLKSETSPAEDNDYLHPDSEVQEISPRQFNSRVSNALTIPGSRLVDIPSISSQTIRPALHRLPQQTIQKAKTFQTLGRHSELARQNTVKKLPKQPAPKHPLPSMFSKGNPVTVQIWFSDYTFEKEENHNTDLLWRHKKSTAGRMFIQEGYNNLY
jgi:hypothetical protein